MGFPLEQVARIMEKLGKDDKKVCDFSTHAQSVLILFYFLRFITLQIVEHLIRLGELLDLGFDEQKISDALLKFDNNKEKALDFLIS